MRFALLGDHPDGLEMARALAISGRHEVIVYSGASVGTEYLRRWGLQPRRVGDLEEVLADPEVDAVIVAGGPAQRSGQLRRAVQSERHVLCVCPVDDSPDIAYEAAMAQADAGTVLFPLLPEPLHPAFKRLAELAQASSLPWKTSPVSQAVVHLDHEPRATVERASPPLGPLSLTARLVEVERWSMEEVLLEADEEGHKPGFPGWGVLRLLGGDIREVFALAGCLDAERGEPLLLAGQFVKGGLFQAAYLPGQAEARLRVALVNREGRAELLFPQAWPGPARLSYVNAEGQEHVETWDSFDPWSRLVTAFEATIQTDKVTARASLEPSPAQPTWQDAIRELELDDAARRSIERRRVSTLEYQEATEEAGFKGTMTLVGCSMLWISLMLLILSAWLPWLGWIIAPVFGIFLVMQLLRWLVPAASQTKESGSQVQRPSVGDQAQR